MEVAALDTLEEAGVMAAVAAMMAITMEAEALAAAVVVSITTIKNTVVLEWNLAASSTVASLLGSNF